ncbi:MAG: 1-(5-phosphoribosyl)-5-[(5-phosphoribosylamino)methylideneamino]imidazole-4-carboxamide isomerase [Sandaracinus sp.]
MELLPAIDLLDQRVVRLTQGRYDQVTVYAEDAVAEARRFADAGAARIHVVDLEGARSGQAAHAALVRRIVRDTPAKVQIGGGVRDRATADAWLEAGADRVVVGTAAITSPAWVRALAQEDGARVVIALDARNGEVKTSGWLEGSGVKAVDVAREVDGWGVAAILYTDIDRDGTGRGANVEATAHLQSLVRATVIASGGIGSLDDLRALRAAGVRAAVCGRALYEGAFTVEEALEACR